MAACATAIFYMPGYSAAVYLTADSSAAAYLPNVYSPIIYSPAAYSNGFDSVIIYPLITDPCRL